MCFLLDFQENRVSDLFQTFVISLSIETPKMSFDISDVKMSIIFVNRTFYAKKL